MGGNYQKSVYNQLMEVMDHLNKVEAETKREVGVLKVEITELKKENAELKEKNRKLTDDNERLRSIINNDSSNTSLPPSGDQKPSKKANEYNGREKSGRKAGGQKGHKGTTLTKADIQKKLKEHPDCKLEVVDGDKPVKGADPEVYTTRYVVDLDAVLRIKEVRFYPDEKGKYHIPAKYNSEVIYGEGVQALAVMLYTQGVMANDRIAEFLNMMSGGALELSGGSIYGFCKRSAEGADSVVRELEKEMLNAPVVSTDATVVTVDGVQNYIRNISTEKTVVYKAMQKKTIDALNAIEFLDKYIGILMHDHETALYHFGTGHAECNVHVIRYLRKNSEDTGNEWSDKMIALLCRMNEERKDAEYIGRKQFTEAELRVYEAEYLKLIEEGYEENKATDNRYAKRDEKTLLNRLSKYKENHLLFLNDFRVPFHNNMSETDLRKAKNRQKMAGGFRKESGHAMYCTIMSIVETLKRRKMPLLENLKKLIIGTPAIF